MKKIFILLATIVALASCTDKITTDDHADNYKIENPWVDMALPSGNLWFCMNIGASSPTDAGDFFAWGETAPKEDYSWSTYKFWTGEIIHDDSTNYCDVYRCHTYGFDYLPTTLSQEDDICSQKCGASSHIASVKDWRELFDNTTYSYKKIDGVACIEFKSRVNDAVLVFPLAGVMEGAIHHSSTFNPTNFGPMAWLWTSDAIPEDHYYPASAQDQSVFVTFNEAISTVIPKHDLRSTLDRCYGMNVRAVKSVK